MAGGSSTGGKGAITGINVTPLVDITLVLLIVFMVTAKLIVSQKAMTVDLPTAQSGDQVQEILSVVLAAPDGIQVNGDDLANDDALQSRASEEQRRNPDVRAVLRADGTVRHSRVMHALDQLRLAGISRVAFAVVPAPAESSNSGESSR